MAGAGISGLAVFYATAGGVLLWSGLKGQTVAETVKAIVSGNSSALKQAGAQTVGGPTVSLDAATSGSGGGSGGGSVSGSFPVSTASAPLGSSVSGSAALLAAAKLHGWASGPEWNALNYVEMREAGYSPTARNPSGALGLAQALGHGNANTGGTLGNEYGGYGLTDAQAREANSGNAYWQAVWMCNYIEATYGDPIAAAAHEKAVSWY